MKDNMFAPVHTLFEHGTVRRTTREHCLLSSTTTTKKTSLLSLIVNILHDRFIESTNPLLPAEQHVDQQLQQFSLANHRPEEQFSDEARCDALKRGRCEEDSSKTLLVPRVKELDHLAQGVLSFLLQPLNKQSCLKIWDIC